MPVPFIGRDAQPFDVLLNLRLPTKLRHMYPATWRRNASYTMEVSLDAAAVTPGQLPQQRSNIVADWILHTIPTLCLNRLTILTHLPNESGGKNYGERATPGHSDEALVQTFSNLNGPVQPSLCQEVF